MATPKKVVTNFASSCKFCLKELELSKSGHVCKTKRRDLTSEASQYLLISLKEVVPEFSVTSGKAFLCQECVNRMNKFERIRSKYLNVKSEYEKEKCYLSEFYKSTEGRRVKRVLITPQRPRMSSKLQRVESSEINIQVQKSPSRIPVPTGPNKENFVPMISVNKRLTPKKEQPQARKRLSLVNEQSPCTAQVTYNYPSQIKKKILDNNPTHLKIARAIVDERPKQLVLAVWNDTKMREELNDLISSTINNECSNLCSIRESESSVLRQVDAQQLLCFEFSRVHEEWKSKSPLFYKLVESAVSSNPVLQHNQIVNMVVAGSALLRSRNQKMSAISHIVGLLLDYGGANDETIHRMNSLGISVSPDSVYLKKKEIAKLHDQQVEEKLTDYKTTKTDIRLCKNMLKSIEELDLPGKSQDEAPAYTSNNATAITTQSQTDLLNNIFLVKENILYHNKVCYTNPLLSQNQPTASLVTKVSDIEIINKNTERVETAPCTNLLYKSVTLSNSDFSEVVCTSLTDVENTKKYTEQFAQQKISKAQSLIKTEIYGDNCDLRVNRVHQSKDQKAKDFHWFLSLAAEQRVSGSHLPDTHPQRPITQVSNQEFLPSVKENHELLDCFAFHVQRVLVENVKCLEIFKKVLAPYITHSHINEFRKKSEYFLIDLHDKNESKNEDMIDILSDLQEKCVPYTDTSLQDKNNVVERKVFGGDVLTNERAYQAQLDMSNGETQSEKLMGFIHRPEGLHRLMNFLKYIFETFYLTSSVNEQGTMYQLKCMLDRRDVKVDMTSAYRQCKNFFDDVLDGHIVAAACHYFGLKDQYAFPTQNKIPMFINQIPVAEQLDWINNVAKSILDIYVMEESTAVPDIYEDTEYMATQMASLTDMDEENRFKCPHTDCPKAYKQFHWLKRHLKNKHNITVNINPPQNSQSLTSAKYDGVYNVASAFMKVGLLFRDTDDAFRMGDGNRLIRNAKFELLHFHQGHHIKYRLWMWRVLAYYMSILSEREAYEYKWNMSVNLGRGIGHLIPNDNLVEMNVHLLKDQCRKMGANVTFEGCRKWVKCLKYLHELSETVDVATKKSPRSGKHTKAKRDQEIALIVQELVQKEVFKFTPNREHASFPNFSSDLLASVDTLQLNQWMNRNKIRAAKEMQI